MKTQIIKSDKFNDEEDGSELDKLEDGEHKQVIITKEHLKEWSDLLVESERPFSKINKITKAFRGALNSIIPGQKSKGDFKIEGSDKFNCVIRLFIKEMIPLLFLSLFNYYYYLREQQ
jgi:hypothetical protein